MISVISRSILVTFSMLVILCGVYPLAVTVFGRMLFNEKAHGSLLYNQQGQLIGSKLIGQVFTKPEYFHGRPSSAGTGYDGANSSGSNLGPTSQKLSDAIKTNIENVLKENSKLKKGEVPVDMVTASASGLDPHISPENAWAQASRVAEARRVSVEQINQAIQSHIEAPFLGLFGEPVVNVLLLNLDLDRQLSTNQSLNHKF